MTIGMTLYKGKETTARKLNILSWNLLLCKALRSFI